MRRHQTPPSNLKPPSTARQLSFEEALLPGWRPLEDGHCATVREAHAALDMTVYAPVYAIRLVRTDTVKAKDYGKIRKPCDVEQLLKPLLAGVEREHFFCLMLSTKNDVLGITLVSMGDLSSTIVHPREVFKAAVLASAASIVVAHNHPSGDPSPSPEDLAVTKRLAEAGALLGIELLDHVVIGASGHFISLKEKGFF